MPNARLEGEYVGVLTASKSKSLLNIPLLSKGREPITKTPKVTLITSYYVKTNGKNTPLLVANMHAMNFVSQTYFDHQLSELYKMLLPYVGKKAIIVSGDFNTWTSHRIAKLNDYMAKLQLVEVPLTNATTPPWYAWLFPYIEKKPLDHVYFSEQKLALKTAKVIKGEEEGGCIKSSDHKPIYIEFLVRE